MKALTILGMLVVILLGVGESIFDALTIFFHIHCYEYNLCSTALIEILQRYQF